MWHRLKWWSKRVRHTLWVRPLIYAVLAVAVLVLAAVVDRMAPPDSVPEFSRETLEDLLAIIASSMLSVATLAVASMVAAYASASATATPRAFSLVVADDVSQTALSGFVGAFIFGIAGLTAVKTEGYGPVGLFLIFSFTIFIFAGVIMLFLRWVDRIARLGRLGNTISRVETAACAALDHRRHAPTLRAARAEGDETGVPVLAVEVGYVQTIDFGLLQRVAEQTDTRLAVKAPPGTFVSPDKALVVVMGSPHQSSFDDDLTAKLRGAFITGSDRTFDEDPRFGVVALAEIAARALSPAVNDPGTAIAIIGAFVRLFVRWIAPVTPDEIVYDRVLVPVLSITDLYDDAFTAIARDGAGAVEVGIRLQKAFVALSHQGHAGLAAAAQTHSALALIRAERVLVLDQEKRRLRELAAQVAGDRPGVMMETA